MEREVHGGLCLLSLDGGGIRGISELFILEEIMYRLKRKEKLDHDPLPADYFDLMAGTSTGGLIAVLLGRLRFSIPDAIEAYRVLAKNVFSAKKPKGMDGTYKASNLKKAVESVLVKKLGKGHAEEKMFELESHTGGICKTFLCAVPSQHIDRKPRLFRTWSADKNPGYNCAVWEACRATTAAPTFFKPMLVGPPGLQEEFIDAGLGCNNPVNHLIQEAEREFGPRDVGCIVSIGAGMQGINSTRKSTKFGLRNILPLDLIEALKRMATDSEHQANEMKERFRSCPRVYFRLNVARGLEDISLAEWDKMSDVKTHTIAYLEDEDVSREVDRVVSVLLERPRTYNLGQPSDAVPDLQSTTAYYHYPSTSRASHFTPRIGPFSEIESYSRVSKTGLEPQVAVLHGMGGCGKSQLALEFCRQSKMKGWFSAIFWIDVSSPTRAAQSFLTIARECFDVATDETDPLAGVAIVRAQMKKLHLSWLLVLDNFDEPGAFGDPPIEQFFLDCAKGFVLVTSRDSTTQRLGHGVALSGMLVEEALDLLRASSGLPKNENTIEEGNAVVNRLGCLPLAVDQAGAYIQVRGIDFSAFLVHFDHRRGVILQETPAIWSYKRKLSEEEGQQALSAATTWELSLEQVSGDHDERERKEHLLTLAACFHNQSIPEAIFVSKIKDDWKDSLRDCWDHYAFVDAISELRKLHLIQTLNNDPSHPSFSIHPLVQDWIKLRLAKESLISYVKEAIQLLANCLSSKFNPARAHDLPLQVQQDLVLHIDSVIENWKLHLDEDTQLERPVSSSRYWLARFLFWKGRSADARILLDQFLVWARENLPEQDSMICPTRHFLARAYLSQRQPEKAEEVLTPAIESSMRLYGPDGKWTLGFRALLAPAYLAQNQYAKAEKLATQTFEISSKVFGSEHEITLICITELACVHMRRSQWEKAEGLLRPIINTGSRVCGPGHHLTLHVTRLLAIAYQAQGRHERAEELLVNVKELDSRKLGQEHHITLTSMLHLAVSRKALGRTQEAIDLMQDVVRGQKKVLGATDPDTQDSVRVLDGWRQESLR